MLERDVNIIRLGKGRKPGVGTRAETCCFAVAAKMFASSEAVGASWSA
jgi:hypothetical protein